MFLLSQILSTCPMSRLQVVFRRRYVCDEIIHYTMTCSFVYPATVLGKFQRGCLLKSDMSSGDFASSCRGRLSIRNLHGHTPWVFDWISWATSYFETDCIIQDHHISDSSQIFSGCPFRCTFCFRRHTSWWRERSAQQYTLSQCLCVWGMSRNLAPFCSQNIIISFKNLCKIIMLLKTFTNIYILLSDIHQSQWCWADIIVYTNLH